MCSNCGDNLYFTKVERMPVFGGVGWAYAYPIPPKTDYFQLFRELLSIDSLGRSRGEIIHLLLDIRQGQVGCSVMR